MATRPTETSPQRIRFCRSADGTRLAYATHGSGPPLVVVSCWLSNLQHDWESPVWRHFLDDLGRFSTLVRYDERGFGLSDWNVTDFSLDARVADLEAVVNALGLERFALMGMSGTSRAALLFAARYPERVTRLIMYGGIAGVDLPLAPDQQAEDDAYRALVRAGWARPDPVFRRVFTNLFIPGATSRQMEWFDELQRTSTSTQNMLIAYDERMRDDVRALLPTLSMPTLILHARDDRIHEFGHARLMASAIPRAQLVALDSGNHILLADEAAWQVFVAQVERFLAPDSATVGPRRTLDRLSAREHDVLTLAADGLTNDEIAAHLTLSVRTVERHLSNVYAKLGLAGRTARAAAVAAFVRQPG